MSEPIRDLMAQLRALHKRATPPPWDNEYSYNQAGVFKRPNDAGVPVGKCYYCQSPDAEMVTERKTYHVHRHPHPASVGYDFWHQINNDKGARVAGNYDYEDGGIISQEDAALIVAVRNALPALLDALDPPKSRRRQPRASGEDREG